MKKKLLVLGIGPAQVDLIKAAKEMNMEVYACAANKSGPGLSLVDDFRVIDIKDRNEVQKYAEEKQVDFIYTMALESATETIAVVSDALGLPSFVSMDTLSKLNNKSVWRSSLGRIEGNVMSFSGNNVNEFEFWDSYPAILKPADGSGQRGVYRVNSFSDVKNIFDKSMENSRIKELIIEEYVDGPEISVNSFMIDGELKFAVISDRISYDEYPGGIVKEHHVPSRIIDKSAELKIIEMVKNVNNIMGLNNGHIYFQLKLRKNEPKLIEFTPRFDACHMWRLILVSTGVDLRKVALEHLAYKKSDILDCIDLPISSKYYKTIFISDETYKTVNRESYKIPDNLNYIQWYYEDGQKVKKVTGYLEKIGYYIIEG